MSVVIEQHVSINRGGQVDWKVKRAAIVVIGGDQYVRMEHTSSSLIRMLCEGLIDKLPKNSSLAACDGMTELSRLRNEQQRTDLKDRPAVAVVGLFEAQEALPAKKQRRSAAKLKELRGNPEVVTVAVPGFAGRPDKPIKMIRPVHPCDAIAVPLIKEVLEFVFDFVRDRGINIDILSAKRDYGAAGSECKGIWKTKTGFVVKMPDDAGVRYKRAKTFMRH